MIRDDNYITNLLEPFLNSDTQQCDISQCCFTSTIPESLDWTSAYNDDIDTRFITYKLLDSQQVAWNDKDLFKINYTYRLPLKDNTIQIVNNKLALFKPILANDRHAMLIIVPISLRRKLFSHYHAGLRGKHMGEYKTLYKIRLRICLPKLREDIKQWVKNCAHCIVYNVWHNRRQELHFSWPVIIPFYIMHLDIWSPGNMLNEPEDGEHILNCMCDLTQFIVSCILIDARSGALSKKSWNK